SARWRARGRARQSEGAAAGEGLHNRCARRDGPAFARSGGATGTGTRRLVLGRGLALARTARYADDIGGSFEDRTPGNGRGESAPVRLGRGDCIDSRRRMLLGSRRAHLADYHAARAPAIGRSARGRDDSVGGTYRARNSGKDRLTAKTPRAA